MIKQLLNSVIAKYRDLSVSRRSIICLSLRRRQIIDLLATDKSRYFAQTRPIIVNYYSTRFAAMLQNKLHVFCCLFFCTFTFFVLEMVLEYRHYGFYCRGTISTADARQAIERAKIGSRGGQRVLYVRTKNILLPVGASSCILNSFN